MIYILFIIGLILLFLSVYFYFKYIQIYENDLLPLKQVKLLLNETCYIFDERLLFPPIIPLKNIIKLNFKKIYKYPIILLPDIGGNKLYCKTNSANLPQNCLQSNDWSVIWPNNKALNPTNKWSKCWKYKFESLFENGQIRDKQGVLISAYRTKNYNNGKFKITDDFGGVDSIDILQIIDLSISYGFYPFILFLKKNYNYIPKSNLFGAPYDFRKISNKDYLYSYFNKIKDLIEYSYKNNKLPSIIIGHGLGGLLFLYFLNFYLPDTPDSQLWKNNFIKLFIPINTPFGGCELALKALLHGTNEGIGLASLSYDNSEWYHDIQKLLGGLFLMIPNSDLFNRKIPDIKGYTEFIKKLSRYYSRPPKVPVYCITSSNYKKQTLINHKQSLYEKKYYNKSYSKLQEKLKSDKMIGDGIVPFISQQIPLLWVDNNLDDINHLHYNIIIKRVIAGHKTILNNKDFLKLFLEIFL